VCKQGCVCAAPGPGLRVAVLSLLWGLCFLSLCHCVVDHQVQARELFFCVVCARSGCSFEACVSAAWWWVAPVRAACCSRGGKAVCVHESAQAALFLELNYSWWVCSFVLLGVVEARVVARLASIREWCGLLCVSICLALLACRSRLALCNRAHAGWSVGVLCVASLLLAFGRPRCGPGFLPLACWVSCSCNPTARQAAAHAPCCALLRLSVAPSSTSPSLPAMPWTAAHVPMCL
jgi:hypothetical protein